MYEDDTIKTRIGYLIAKHRKLFMAAAIIDTAIIAAIAAIIAVVVSRYIG
jgi:hypothetical protein